MAEYKSIKGFKVQYLSADPSDPIIGQTWYNSTSKDLKYTGVTTAGAWATGNPINTTRAQGGGAGTSTAGIIFGGEITTETAATEEYDGNSWTNSNNMITARRILGSAGLQTAALCVAGEAGPPLSNVEEYDGISWTAGGALPVSRSGNAAAGLQTAAIAFGGSPGPQVASFTYDGTTWTPAPNMNTDRYRLTGSGTQTAALGFAGNTPPPTYTAATEEYNGTAWTSVNSMNTAGQLRGGTGQGTQTASLGFGGNTNPVATALLTTATEEYDGTSWTNVAGLPVAKGSMMAGGTLSNAFSAGGGAPTGQVSTTEEWIGAGSPTTKAITVS
jgi:hypothetical protein